MKVYIVLLEFEEHPPTIQGIFSTGELASKYIKNAGINIKKGLYVESWVLDEIVENEY